MATPSAPADRTLVDVEAPPQGGDRVDTPAYAAPPAPDAGRRAPADDLIDVEAPPRGGAAVDTPAYAAAGGATPARSGSVDDAPSRVEAQAPPPAPAAAPEPAADRAEGEGGSPPLARPAPGRGPAPSDAVDRAAEALLRLAADRPWREVSLRDIAVEAGVPFAELYARAPGKAPLLLRLSARLDRLALERIAGDDQPGARDRLFEAMMSRLELMEPHRAALIAIGRAEGAALAPALPRTARALLEGAGVDTGGGRGALRLAAVTAAWVRVLQVWRDDEGALNRTMAEIDKLLARADGRLKRVGAGF